ncbi:peptide ABC transporter substrate-binding protein [Dictyobacter kobayashii]|uniref:ABC transporter substrate-binding protein n=1 Tax=Dictyobacter kobayashii TaxID=2014872 RepID=A0A402AN94_9CHLR|nr:peptide ABC transporter substrate-binding protein [Dictyobacter kobayashii]GCE20485.1 ABC transporter substrate-binding protein [Dictyobacter kobayashii]
MPIESTYYSKRGPKALHVLLVLGCLIPLVLAACSNPFGGDNNTTTRQLTKAPRDKQTYSAPLVGITDFDTLDPALAHDPASIQAIQMMYTGLVQLDDKLQVQPQLAQSWQQQSDGVTWTFKLRPHLTFSDGTPLTSADVAYSLNRALQPATKSTVAPIYLRLIKDSDQLLAGRISTLLNDSILTPDPQTVVIVTNKQAAYFLSMLTYTCAYVVEKKLIDEYQGSFTDHLNEGGGAGPFKVGTYTHRARIDFVPNAHYYSHQPQLQKVSYIFYHTAQEAYQAYANNQIDMTGVPLSTLANDRKRQDYHQVPQLWINYYTMNYLTKPFDNIHIRQAFALAIDKTAIARDVWKDTVIATNHIIPSGMPGYNPQVTGPDGTSNLKGNLKKAQALLQQGLQEEKISSVAGLPPIQLTYVSGVDSFDQEVKALVKTWQQALNIQVTLNPVDYNTLLDKVTGATGNANGIQMWGLAWVGEYPDPQDWLSQQFAKGSINNNLNYGQNTSTTAAQQQLLQQKLGEADANRNATERLQSYQQAEQQLINDVAWLPMEQVTETFLRNPNIIGITDNAQGNIAPDDWAHIYRVQ